MSIKKIVPLRQQKQQELLLNNKKLSSAKLKHTLCDSFALDSFRSYNTDEERRR